LLFGNKGIALCAERVHLKYIGIATVGGGVDDDFEVVVQMLGDIATQFGGDDLLWFGVKTRNSEINGVLCIENANFSAFRWLLAFVGFALQKIRDGSGLLPQRIVECAVELWRSIDRGRL